MSSANHRSTRLRHDEPFRHGGVDGIKGLAELDGTVALCALVLDLAGGQVEHDDKSVTPLRL